MRTSNKILLGIFLGPLIILTLLQLTLYAKLKSGHFVVLKTVQEDRYIRLAPKNINNIAVYGLNNFRIISSDSLKLEIEKDERSHLHYVISGDSLIIHGDSIINQPGRESDIERSYQSVNLYLPSVVAIAADNSDITVEGSKDSLNAKSYHFTLTNSAGLKIEDNGDDSKQVYFKTLGIQASHSAGIELTGHTCVSDLQLSLIQSAFTDNGAFVNQLSIDADKTSNISLKGDNLQKLNLIKKP
jgi:hypothetical protein